MLTPEQLQLRKSKRLKRERKKEQKWYLHNALDSIAKALQNEETVVHCWARVIDFDSKRVIEAKCAKRGWSVEWDGNLVHLTPLPTPRSSFWNWLHFPIMENVKCCNLWY
jgi:hypothetical protein